MSVRGENLSLVLHPSQKLTLEKSDIPEPKETEVLIAIRCTGICASDIHMWAWGELAKMKTVTPTVLGHESSGTVVKVGKSVKNFKAGDRVVIETSGPCLGCPLCLEGNYHLCPDLKRLGACPHDGTFTRYITHSAQFCYKLPDKLTFEEGALVEPLAVALHACRRGRVTGGDKVLICGAGAIGLLTMLTAKAFGATRICVTDVRKDRLEFAKKLGADCTVLADPDDDVCVRRVVESLGANPDVSLDCCGFQATVTVALKATKPRGVVVVVGIGPGDSKLPLPETMLKEVDIVGVNRYPNCYQRAIDLLESGAVNGLPVITHSFKLEEAIEAFEFVKREVPGTVKTMIRCHPE
ncbi:sorbitol dehydrogenase-like [Centruroides sculpturatus]|uniref:sorbitol dehydrogenase-like n=1 Tax=Centruroides sculpturatus TaxID=218467 RepID=UPI000C6EEF51|nr:sorbitol dehydrogenase-like [Centruroides sculpturatus]